MMGNGRERRHSRQKGLDSFVGQRVCTRAIRRENFPVSLSQLVDCEPFADLPVPVDPVNLFPGEGGPAAQHDLATVLHDAQECASQVVCSIPRPACHEQRGLKCLA